MNTTTAPDHPDLMPIWARLQLAKQGIPFQSVNHWEREHSNRVAAYLTTGNYALLYKR